MIDLEDDEVFLGIIAETERISYYLDKVDSQSLESLLGKLCEYLQRESSEEEVLTQVVQWLDVFSANPAFLSLVSPGLLQDICLLLNQVASRAARLVSARLSVFLHKGE